ncbi:MAG: rhomboid family intramembrane serine protease [Erysipelotrichaceae bacterium]|nr:rhomboid family intramembrane serine protease [Erysipelotrichaceae bacterium]
MNNSDVCKIYQLMEFFVCRYNYISLGVKNLMGANEVYCVNKDDPNFKIIRISSDSLDKTNNELPRIKAIMDVAEKQLNAKNPVLLDIHIGYGEAEDTEFETVFIDNDYINGIDLEAIFPGIGHVVHLVDNQEEEIKRLILSINTRIREAKEQAKKKPFLAKLKEQGTPVTHIVMLMCLFFYFSVSLMALRSNKTAALIAMGADYKEFTLGLKQFYRLFTNAFLHSSILHLACNMLSLNFIGQTLEKSIGSIKYLIILLVGVVFASLTHGAVTANSLMCGLSGGIYCLFTYMCMYYIEKGYFNLNSIMPTLMLNMMLNFMPGVAWQTHLGGAVCGLMFYYIFQNEQVNKQFIVVLVIMSIALGYKYVSENSIQPFYGATDAEVVKLYRDIGMNKTADKLEVELYKMYYKESR